MRLKFKQQTINKKGNAQATFQLSLGGITTGITYYPQNYHVKTSKGVQLNAGIAKKLAFTFRAWSQYNSEVHNINGWEDGDILDFNDGDGRVYGILGRATQYHKEWRKEKKERKDNDKNTNRATIL